MRSAKRSMTPQLQDLFRRQERGQGTFETYTAWNRLRRSDPPSAGRSHLQPWSGRQVDLSSDLRLVGFLFATQLQELTDLREQFPLALKTSRHEISHYDVRHSAKECPGTLELARCLRIQHPRVGDDRTGSEPKVLTTDQLLTLRGHDGDLQMLAVSLRYRAPKESRGRLGIERAYWEARDVPWLLITADQFDPAVALSLRRTACWALGEPVGEAHLAMAVAAARATRNHPLTETLRWLERKLGDLGTAQRALWQAIWIGRLPVDLNRGWRPQEPLRLIDEACLRACNPIASRRSAWN